VDNIGSVVLEISEREEDDVTRDDPDLGVSERIERALERPMSTEEG
jgi:hypothetical protein